jgi:putative transposase
LLVRLKPSERKGVIVVTMSKRSSKVNPHQLELKFATAGSQAENHLTTSKDKSPPCEASIPKPKLSETSEVGLTLNERDFGAYWTDDLKEISSALLLPIGIDSPEKALNSLNTWSNQTVENSWFSIKLFTAPADARQAPKRHRSKLCRQYHRRRACPTLTSRGRVRQKNLQPIDFQSSTSSHAACKLASSSTISDCGQACLCPEKSGDSSGTVTKSKKIRIYPDREQKATLRKWFAASRYAYNQAVEHLKTPETLASWKAIKTPLLHSMPDWTKEVPYQIKSVAIRDACFAVSNAKKKFLQTREFQEVRFRSRRQPKQTIYIPKSAITNKGVYHTLLGALRITEQLPDNPRDSRLTSENGQFHLVVTYDDKTTPPKPSGRASSRQGLLRGLFGACRVVALDPGVRTFLTVFSEESFGWLGHHCIGRIQRLCQHLDNLLSRAAKAKRQSRRNMRRAANQIRLKIKNLVSELHRKLAKFLVSNFDIILLPTFETQQMCKRACRKLRKKSVRQMLTLSHYRFKQFLLHKAKEFGVTVLDVCEAYTSKTVSWTGEVIHNLGGRKVIKAGDGTKMDRDLNGARGIFLRALGDSPMLQNLVVL